MTATISSTVGGSAGYQRPSLRGGRPPWKPGIVAGRSTTAGGIEQHREHETFLTIEEH